MTKNEFFSTMDRIGVVSETPYPVILSMYDQSEYLAKSPSIKRAVRAQMVELIESSGGTLDPADESPERYPMPQTGDEKAWDDYHRYGMSRFKRRVYTPDGQVAVTIESPPEANGARFVSTADCKKDRLEVETSQLIGSVCFHPYEYNPCNWLYTFDRYKDLRLFHGLVFEPWNEPKSGLERAKPRYPPAPESFARELAKVTEPLPPNQMRMGWVKQ